MSKRLVVHQMLPDILATIFIALIVMLMFLFAGTFTQYFTAVLAAVASLVSFWSLRHDSGDWHFTGPLISFVSAIVFLVAVVVYVTTFI